LSQRNLSLCLRDACQKGNVSTIKWIFGKCASLHLKTSTDNPLSLLCLAAKYGKLNAVEWLVEHGGLDADSPESALSPLWLAARYRHPTVVRYLLDRGVPQRPAGEGTETTPLGVAACVGDLEIAKLLLQAGQPGLVNEVATSNGAAPLWIAAAKGHVAVCQWLVSHTDADHSATSATCSMNALAVAAHFGHEDLACWLIEHSTATCGSARGFSKATRVLDRLQRKVLATALEGERALAEVPGEVASFISESALLTPFL
jgi:ankyrin repeat protein